MFKLLVIVSLSLGIWLGVKANRFMLDDRCLDAGGSVAATGICIGVTGQ